MNALRAAKDISVDDQVQETKYSPCHAVLQFLESCEAPRMSKRGFLHWKLTKRSSYEALWSLKAFYQFSSHDSFRAPFLASVYTTGFKGNYKTRQKICEVSSAVCLKAFMYLHRMTLHIVE